MALSIIFHLSWLPTANDAMASLMSGLSNPRPVKMFLVARGDVEELLLKSTDDEWEKNNLLNRT